MENLISLISKYEEWIRFFHIAGSIIAIGSVVAADIALIWLKFKPNEAKTLAKISPLFSLQIWIGLLILSISGLLLYLPRAGLENYNIFQFKMLLVLIVFLNGIFLNLWVTPKFKKLVPDWNANNTEGVNRVRTFTIIAGISTTISFIAWWGIIILMEIFY